MFQVRIWRHWRFWNVNTKYHWKFNTLLFFSRTREEIQEVRGTRDPILGFKEKIIEAGLVTSEELKEMEMAIRKSVDADVKKAKTDPEIGVEELYYDVYEKNLEGELRGLVPWEKHQHKNTQKALNL